MRDFDPIQNSMAKGKRIKQRHEVGKCLEKIERHVDAPKRERTCVHAFKQNTPTIKKKCTEKSTAHASEKRDMN